MPFGSVLDRLPFVSPSMPLPGRGLCLREVVAVLVVAALVFGLCLGKVGAAQDATVRVLASALEEPLAPALGPNLAGKDQADAAEAGDKRICLHGILPCAPRSMADRVAVRLAPTLILDGLPGLERAPPHQPPRFADAA